MARGFLSSWKKRPLRFLSDPKLRYTPKVVLVNCFASQAAKGLVTPRRDEVKKVVTSKCYPEDAVVGILTPCPSSSSSGDEGSASDPVDEPARKRRKKDDRDLYDVESIEGYQMDSQTGEVRYVVKWLGYGREYNSVLPLRDLVNCNRKLLEFFKVSCPGKELKEMDAEVAQSLTKGMGYQHRFMRGDLRRADLERFPEDEAFSLSSIFGKRFNRFHSQLQTEYKYVIRCLIGMKRLGKFRDEQLYARARDYKIALMLCNRRREQLKRLKEQEDVINQVENCPIQVINLRDFDVLPDFVYVTEVVPGPGVIIPNDPRVGCSCKGRCGPRTRCCGRDMVSNYKFAYDEHGRLNLSTCSHIFECNRECPCPMDCPNRVIQRGRRNKLAIMKSKYCGWGVKTLEGIKVGEFVCEYTGELMLASDTSGKDEYHHRGHSYTFALDYNPDRDAAYCLDATRLGNVARFINHSCDPNLVVRPFWVDCLDRDKQRIAFFAKRDIVANEELSIDYESVADGSPTSATEVEHGDPSIISYELCLCKKPNCRKWLFRNTYKAP